MKKIVAIIFSISLICISSFVSCQGASAASIDTNHPSTQQAISESDFVSYLNQQSLSADLQVQKIAKENLETFLNFSETEKQTFINTLNNPTQLENNLTVTDTTTIDSNNPNTPQLYSTRQNVGHNFDFSLLGINMYGLHLDVTYYTTNGAVTSVTSSNAYVRYSYNPVVRINLISTTQYISADKQGYARAKFSYSIGPLKDMAAQIGVQAISVAGNGAGNLSYTNDWKE